MSNTIHTCIIIGTGFSGLAMAIALQKKGIQDFVLLEKSNAIGGTWRENTYPGAECDIPSALYSYSFELYPDWEYKWSMQPQILDYIKHVATKYKLYPHIRFQQEMTAAYWNELEGHWSVQTKSGATFLGKTLIPAIGQLHHPSTPNFEGKDLFEKPNWHSAQWNHEVSLEGKTVGVIGNAASAVQFIPEIAKTAGNVTIFQRSPNWMIPKQDRAYKEWEKKLVRRLPILLKMYRLRLWLTGGVLFFVMKNSKPTLLRSLLQRYTKWYINKHIKDSELAKNLIPNYPLGAKRVLFSDTYYPALARSNVKVVTGGVRQITEKGVIGGDGKEHEIDILVYATGFKTNPFLLGLDVRGKDGVSIQEHWREEPKNYLGITVNQFPNLFMMYGPNTNLGHNSIIVMSEAQANYIAQCIRALEQNNWKSMEVKEQSLNEYYQKTQARLKKMVWAAIDDSWYKSSNGNLPNNYPGRTMEYMRVTRKVDFGAYHLVAN